MERCVRGQARRAIHCNKLVMLSWWESFPAGWEGQRAFWYMPLSWLTYAFTAISSHSESLRSERFSPYYSQRISRMNYIDDSKVVSHSGHHRFIAKRGFQHIGHGSEFYPCPSDGGHLVYNSDLLQIGSVWFIVSLQPSWWFSLLTGRSDDHK